MQFFRSIRLNHVSFQLTALFLVLFIGLPNISAQSQIPLVDPTFRPDLPGNDNGEVNDMVLQADGSIVIGGSFESVAGEPIGGIARLFSDGELDDTFGSGTDNGVLGLAQQTDGKIIVDGYFTNLQGMPAYGMGRLLANGEVDTNFNVGALFAASNDTPFKLALRPDGKILVSTLGGTLFQILTNGALDPAFIQTNVFFGFYIHSLFVDTNGSALIGGGFTSVNGFESPALVQLDAAGQVNTNFQTGFAPNSDAFTILKQTNGGFLVGGLFLHTNGTANTVLQRLDSNLHWDASFQTDAFSTSDLGGAFIRSVIVQPDGKIVAGGTFETVAGYHRRHIVRLDASGRIDPCFDPGIGLGGFSGVNIVKLQPDGRVLAGGGFGAPGFVPNEIVRLLPQGDCDATRVYFGSDGDSGYFAAGTWPPGGTHYLQSSTNLIDWQNLDLETGPYLYHPLFIDPGEMSSIYFRIKTTP